MEPGLKVTLLRTIKGLRLRVPATVVSVGPRSVRVKLRKTVWDKKRLIYKRGKVLDAPRFCLQALLNGRWTEHNRVEPA